MLEAQNISFSYGRTPLFEDFSLAVDKGERVALKAPSGFGKSTLCKLMAGYLAPQKGTILLDDAPLPKNACCPVQMIMQHPETAVDPYMRMHEVVAEAGRIPEELFDRFGIEERWLERYPHELSGGELQRFCIVRALGANPHYLIADEISTMLDAVTQAKIWRGLLEEADVRSLGMIIVTHSAALTTRIATRVVDLALVSQPGASAQP